MRATLLEVRHSAYDWDRCAAVPGSAILTQPAQAGPTFVDTLSPQTFGLWQAAVSNTHQTASASCQPDRPAHRAADRATDCFARITGVLGSRRAQLSGRHAQAST